MCDPMFPLVVGRSVRCSCCGGEGCFYRVEIHPGTPMPCPGCKATGYFIPGVDRKPETLDECVGDLRIALADLGREIRAAISGWSFWPLYLAVLVIAAILLSGCTHERPAAPPTGLGQASALGAASANDPEREP